ncbi:MAG TPA: thioredoxin reductase [Planctomycetales bacterium]|jgi:thioredoxin reductase (NADPH)|nr:thioredoxin reductase [Planctomycetales bacterium]
MTEHGLHDAAFPTLDEAQIAALGKCAGGTLKKYQVGQTLFQIGERDFKFFVIMSGEVEILDLSGEKPKTVAIHKAGEFTGDVSHLTGRRSIVSAVARSDCEVYEMSTDALRQVLNQCPDLSDLILQAFIARRQLVRDSGTFTGLRVIGSRYSQDTFRVRDFLALNRVLFTWLDLEADPEVDKLLRQFGLSAKDTPVVAWTGKVLLRNPTNLKLAEAIGLRQPLEQVVYDLAVVGAGPAGLAAAVYGASEGLNTVVLERTAPGGQAGSSARIENYLGFPMGMTGSDLMDRATLQADKFGAHLTIPAQVASLTFDRAYPVLRLMSGETVAAKCLLIATGIDYRRLEVDGCKQFEGCGVYYAATPNETQVCRDADVVVVGGGNSAGQAVVFLAGRARKVFLVIRNDDLSQSMSSYLARRIEQTKNVEILPNTTIRRIAGDEHLTTVEVVNSKTGKDQTLQTPALFSFIGAVPRTDWLPKEIEKDAKGFVRTGPALARSPSWNDRREPFLLETSKPGVFAAGDVRSGSVKRIASAVGEGAMAVQFVHEYLKEM